MRVPVEVAILCGSEGGFIEADRRGGVWWCRGRARAAWGNMRHMLGTQL